MTEDDLRILKKFLEFMYQALVMGVTIAVVSILLKSIWGI